MNENNTRCINEPCEDCCRSLIWDELLCSACIERIQNIIAYVWWENIFHLYIVQPFVLMTDCILFPTVLFRNLFNILFSAVLFILSEVFRKLHYQNMYTCITNYIWSKWSIFLLIYTSCSIFLVRTTNNSYVVDT